MPQITLKVPGANPKDASDNAFNHIALTLEGYCDGDAQADNIAKAKEQFTAIRVKEGDMLMWEVTVYAEWSDMRRYENCLRSIQQEPGERAPYAGPR